VVGRVRPWCADGSRHQPRIEPLVAGDDRDPEDIAAGPDHERLAYHLQRPSDRFGGVIRPDPGELILQNIEPDIL
jgi:hypothetical protein